MKNDRLEKILRATQDELFEMLLKGFEDKVDLAYYEGNFLLIKGEAPVLLVAHLDTVHEESVKDIQINCISTDNGTMEVRTSSPQGIGGDDRCGVYGILQVYQRSQVKPWLLFVCNEEVGCIGSGKFADEYRKEEGGVIPTEIDNVKFIIELDRKGKKDSVFYECDNPSFEDWINSFGFETERGSYSDICEIAPAMHKAAVNLSSGYYNAHTTQEYIVESELDDTIDKVVKLVEESLKEEVPAYEYIRAKNYYDLWDFRDYSSNGNGWDWGWNSYGDAWADREYWTQPDDDWEPMEYHSEDDYRDRSIRLRLGNVSLNFCLEHNLNEEMWAEYVALLDFDSPKELDALRSASGDAGIIDEFKMNFGSWEFYYYDWIAYDDDNVAYC